MVMNRALSRLVKATSQEELLLEWEAVLLEAVQTVVLLKMILKMNMHRLADSPYHYHDIKNPKSNNDDDFTALHLSTLW